MFKMIGDLLFQMIMEVLAALRHNWLTFSIAILLVSVLRAYINVEELKQKLLAKPKVSILGSVAFGILTPLCAAGSLGLVVGLLTTVMPWGPIMAFLTSSPLMSPDAFIMISGVIGTKFAIVLAVASIIIGVSSGYITHFIENKTNFLKNQTRLNSSSQTCGRNKTCGCNKSRNVSQFRMQSCNNIATVQEQACCSKVQENTRTSIQMSVLSFLKNIRWNAIFTNILNIGIKNMLLFFSIFVAVGYLITRFVPTQIIGGLLGSGKYTAVPLAAVIGLPLYITTEASIPLVKALMAQGASAGAMMAFWIAGQTTSAMVIAGLAMFMKKRIILLYIFFVVTGAILAGYAFNLILVFWK